MSESVVLDPAPPPQEAWIDPADCHPPEPTPAAETGATAEGCPNCGSLEPWGKASWCPKCGFYPRLGISIGPALEVMGEAQSEPQTALDVWRRLPNWARVLVAGILAVFAISVAVRVANPRATMFRNTWAALQLVGGLALFFTLHAMAMVRATIRYVNFGFVDAMLHPIDAWRPTFRELPALAPRVWLAAWGLTGAVCAIVILGGVRYAVLVEDWGFRKPVNGAVRARVRISALEKAVAEGALAEDFEKAATERAEIEARIAAEAEARGIDLDVISADCVVIGFKLNADGSVSELLLASLVGEELHYVGSVSDGIPDDVRRDLAARLQTITRDKPFVECSAAGTWVKPIITCKTNFKSWTPDKQFYDVTFKELLGDIEEVK